MGAIRMLCANDLRRRWRATVAIALIVGVVGAVVLAAIAGARRSDTALSRFLVYSRASTLEVDAGLPTPQQVAAFERAIGSPPVGRVEVFGMTPANRSNVSMAAAVDHSFGTTVERPRLIKGRLANPNAVDEVTIGEALARNLRLGVGSTFDTVSISYAQLQRGQFSPPEGPSVRMHIVGIIRRPLDLGNQGAAGGIITMTPAFERAYRTRIPVFTLVLTIRVPNDAKTITHVNAVARQMFGANDNFAVQDRHTVNTDARNAINVVTVAITIFAGIAAVAGSFAAGIVIARDVTRGRPEQSTLRSMGLTRRDRIATPMTRAAVIGAGGAVLAAFGAVALSPLFPFGIARRADPDPGVHADAVVLGCGAIAMLIFVLAVSLTATIRMTRRADTGEDARQTRSVADALGVTRLRPAVATGIRMAFDPGHDERALPVRSAFAGAALGTLGVVAVLVFASSLTALANTPQRYGWTWDVRARDPHDEAPTCSSDASGFDRLPGISAIAILCYRDVTIGGRHTNIFGFTPVRGSITPTIVSGRAPEGDDEAALGRDTLRASRKHVGDIVRIDGSASRDYRIVGVSAFPQLTFGEGQPLADGVVLTAGGYRAVRPSDDDATTRYFLLRAAPGTSPDAVVRETQAFAARHGAAPDQIAEAIGRPTRPPEVDRLRNVSWLLPALAVLLSALALIAAAHAMVTAVRRRRRELAILKALGFERGQARAAVAWQASTLGVVGIVVGMPLGLLVGRFAWSAVARNLGVTTEVSVPLLAVALVVPATLLLVNAVAYLPARAAARMHAAAALATE